MSTVNVCNHFRGKYFTASWSTDTHQSVTNGIGDHIDGNVDSAYCQEMASMKTGIRTTICIDRHIIPSTGKLNGPISDFHGQYQTRAVEFTAYGRTDGAEAEHASTTDGLPAKVALETLKRQQAVYKAITGRYFTIWAWRGAGTKDYQTKSVLMPYLLAGREAASTRAIISGDNVNANTWYGRSVDGQDLGTKHNAYPTGWDSTHSEQMEAMCSLWEFELIASNGQNKIATFDFAKKIFEHARDNQGFYNCFDHEYNIPVIMGAEPGRDLLREKYAFFKTLIDEAAALGKPVAILGLQQAYEYKFNRENVANVSHTVGADFIEVTVTLSDQYLAFQALENISMPLSFEVDVSGTSLVGKNLQAEMMRDIMTTSNPNVFIIDVNMPMQKSGTFKFKIKETQVAEYLNLETPNIITNINGNTLTVNTPNVDTRVAVYPTLESGSENKIMCPQRSNKLSGQHVFNLPTGHYYVGAITKASESTLTNEISIA